MLSVYLSKNLLESSNTKPEVVRSASPAGAKGDT